MRIGACAGAIATLLVSAAMAGAQTRIVPDEFPAALRAMAQQVAPVVRERPDDAAVLYHVAALYARAGRATEALDALRRMEARGTGIHPRLQDGFQSLTEHPE